MRRFREQDLFESIVDPVQPHLSYEVFDFPLSEYPKLKDKVIYKIQDGITQISSIAEVIDYVLIGSIITRRYTKTSDLDITVLVNASAEKLKAVKKLIATLNGKLVDGTSHPINYFIVNNLEDYDRKLSSADGVFDVQKNLFRRRPVFKRFDIRKYIQKFSEVVAKIDDTTNSLISNLFNYEELKNASFAELKYLRLRVLDNLESDAIELSNIYNKIKKERRDAFNRHLTSADIRKYGDRNRLPENVIYKLLEKYHYLDFLHKIDSILGDDKELSPEDANQLVMLFTEL